MDGLMVKIWTFRTEREGRAARPRLSRMVGRTGRGASWQFWVLPPAILYLFFIYSFIHLSSRVSGFYLTGCVEGSVAWVRGLGEAPGPPAQRSSLPWGKQSGQHSGLQGDVTWWPRTQHRRPPGHAHTPVPERHSPEGEPLTLVFPPRYPRPSALALLAGPELGPPEFPDAGAAPTGRPGTPGDQEGFKLSRKLNHSEEGRGPAQPAVLGLWSGLLLATPVVPSA